MSLWAAGRLAGTFLVAALLASGCGPSIIDEVAKDILLAQKYNLTVTGDDHCTTVPSGTVVVSHAELKSISATADVGYHVSGWTHEAGAAVTFANAASSSTTVQLQAGDATIKAWSAPNDYVLTVTAGAGGATDPSGPVDVASGEARAVVATPNTGYHFVNWTLENGSGVTIGDVNALSTTVTLTSTDAEVQANFAINTYTLTVSHTGTGSTTPNGAVVVNHGAATPITATPGSINMLDNWTVTAGTGVTIADPDAESTTATLAGGNATVTANFVEYHGTQTFTESIYYSDTAVAGSKCYVAYYDTTTHDLMFRLSTDRGKTWGAPVTVDSTGDVGMYCSMTVYVTGFQFNDISIAYYDATNKDLKYVTFIDTATVGFSPVIVDSSGDVGMYCQMTWTSLPSTKRCIAYYDQTNTALKIAKTSTGGTAGSWFKETVDNPIATDVGAYCSITCNSSGDFFMAYADTSNTNVKRAYATNVSIDAATTWTIASYAHSTTVEYTGIALNGANGVISFRGGNQLRVLLSTDSFVTLVGAHTTIDSSANAGEYARIRYYNSGAAFWISYNRNNTITGGGSTKLAKSTDNGPNWTLMTVASNSGLSASMNAASFATDGTRLFATYRHWTGLNALLVLAKSTDGGTTW